MSYFGNYSGGYFMNWFGFGSVVDVIVNKFGGVMRRRRK